MKVLFIWKPRSELIEYLQDGMRDHPSIELIFPSENREEFYLEKARECEIIVGWRPSPELLKRAEKLKLFINPGAGVQHQIKPFSELNKLRKVNLVNGHGNSYFTAQHAVALLLSLTNKIIPHHNWMVSGKWRLGDKAASSLPLQNRNVGFLGYGAVNTKVHRFLQNFELTFAALKTNWRRKPEDLKTFLPDELHEFLKYVDILFIALPLTSQTKGLIACKELKLLGKKGLLVQLGRGDIVKENDLYDSLKENDIAGAAIDVWYDYDPDEDEKGRKFPYHFPFHDLPNVILSPHRAASPFDNLERWNEVIENIKRFKAGREDFLNIVELNREY